MLPIALAGAAAPPGPIQGDNEPPVPGHGASYRGRVEETLVIVCSAEQPVTAALCGFPYQSKHRAAVCVVKALARRERARTGTVTTCHK